jgi:hypothetical protein
LETQLKNKPETILSKALMDFEKNYAVAENNLWGKVEKDSSRTRELLDKTGLVVIPANRLPIKDWKLGKWAGLLATAFFLSLGAPFWYNTLRRLADLRPIVARKVEGEPAKALQ